MPVTIVAPAYMNPKHKNFEEQRRRRKRKDNFERHLRQLAERELPEESTVSYYA